MSNLLKSEFTFSKPKLFPPFSDTQNERRAVSIFLCLFNEIPNFRVALLSSLGIKCATRTNTECYTEVHFKNIPESVKNRKHSHQIPDGLVVIDNKNGPWSVLIEAKVDKFLLDDEQIKDYIDIARANKISALLTISNQYAALPTHHPIEFKKSEKRGVDLYHLSWSAVITEATKLLSNSEFSQGAHEFLLKEFVACFSNEKYKVLRYFDSMNSDWPELIKSIRDDKHYKHDDEIVRNAISSWHEEQRDICLKLMKDQNLPSVKIKLPKDHILQPSKRLLENSKDLLKNKSFDFEIDIKNAAGAIHVSADINKRKISCHMETNAPEDKPTSKGKINWFIRQLSHIKADEKIIIEAYWKGRSIPTNANLFEIRENVDSIINEHQKSELRSFSVTKSMDLGGQFENRKKFIVNLEYLIVEFYQLIGENLQRWVPKPPKMKPLPPSEDIEPINSEQSSISAEKIPHFNHIWLVPYPWVHPPTVGAKWGCLPLR